MSFLPYTNLLLFFVFFVPALPVLGLQGDISIDSRVDKSTISIGDLIEYTVEVRRAPEVVVIMPDPGENLGAFELRDYSIHEPIATNGTVTERLDYTISTFDVGNFEIPPLTFYYRLPGDSSRHELKTQKIAIVVESMKPSEAGDIRDIKQPLELPTGYQQYIIWGSIAFATVLLILISAYIWRRKRAGKGLLPQKVEPPRPPHEVALTALEELKESSLLSEGRLKEFYIQLSEIIRRYIEGRYFIIAIEMTTFEVIRELRTSDVEQENVALIEHFLSACDLVKFAKHTPDADQNAEILDRAFELVQKTKLLYEIPLETEGGSEENGATTSLAEPTEAATK